jgi:catechol 2,3-dioxygenase-like lactoylglutathione lyase family enzyme
VLDIDRKIKEAEAFGWNITTKPILYDFGNFKVKEGLLKGPDGVELALIQRIEPPLEGWPNLREFSRQFNSSQVVRDIDVSIDFYINKLGWKVYMKSFEVGKTEVNLLGVPPAFNKQTVHKVCIVQPEGTNEGSVELIQIDGITGQDFSSFATPPNLGILTLRFPVKSMVTFVGQIKKVGVKIEIEPQIETIKPYGKVKIMALRSPDGVWLEFYEVL